MKLYYQSGACSLCAHILLCETGLDYSLESVNLATKIMQSGGDFFAINPKGQVPTIQLDDKSVLTEGIAIAQYIADLAPQANLLAPIGDINRYQVISWFNFIATEIHKNYGPLFRKKSQEAMDDAAEVLKSKFSYVNQALENSPYLTGQTLSIADVYLYVTMRWSKVIPNCPDYPAISAFMARMNERPAVQKALAEEGLK